MRVIKGGADSEQVVGVSPCLVSGPGRVTGPGPSRPRFRLGPCLRLESPESARPGALSLVTFREAALARPSESVSRFIVATVSPAGASGSESSLCRVTDRPTRSHIRVCPGRLQCQPEARPCQVPVSEISPGHVTGPRLRVPVSPAPESAARAL